MRVCSVCNRCFDDSTVSCIDEDHPDLAETRSGSPAMIAGYRLQSLLSSGSNTDVYGALHEASGRSCFIRIVTEGEEERERFLLEAKLAAGTFHPSVTDVYEAGSLDDCAVFAVMEDTEDQTLDEFLKTGTPSLLTTIQMIRQIAEALDSLHTSGLIHRALRPENILVSTDLEGGLLVRLQGLDLGGVVEHSIVSNRFLIDSALDAITYFAPEQLSGDGSSVQTDIYSLGIVFYEMLAGVPPFVAPNAAGLIEKHRHERPPELKIANFDLRMLITHALTESLQKPIRLRQASALTFARQLRHIEQLATHVSTPPPAVAVPHPQVRPEPVATIVYTEVEPVTDPVSIVPSPLPAAAEVLHFEPAVEPPQNLFFLSVEEDEVFAHVPETPVVPRKIEWEQPEDDVPSVDKVLEVLQAEPMIDNGAFQAEMEEITVVRPQKEPLRVEWEEPEYFSQNLAATHFSPRQPIDDGFFPTILGAKPEIDTKAHLSEGSIFSAYNALSLPRTFVSKRSLAAGGVVAVALAILLLNANDLMNRTTFADIVDVPATTRDTSVQQTHPPMDQAAVLSTPNKPTAKNVETPVTNDDLRDMDRIRPVAISAREPQAVETTRPSEPKAGTRQTVPEDRNTGKPSFVPSTIVIASDNGRIRSRVEPKKAAAEPDRVSMPAQTNGLTRPRIVKNPKP